MPHPTTRTPEGMPRPGGQRVCMHGGEGWRWGVNVIFCAAVSWTGSRGRGCVQIATERM